MLRRTAFTLVELLVVIAVIGTLVALLLPAVQQARESARRNACTSNQRQLGLALQGFHDAHQVFPPSGWTVAAPANPAGKFVGWRALVLPHLEQTSLHSRYNFSAHWWEGTNLDLGGQRLKVFFCPSVPQRLTVTSAVAKSPRPALAFPLALAPADYEALMGVQPTVNPGLYATPLANRSVLYRNSATRIAEVTDGTSQTIIVVECGGRPLVYRGRTPRFDLANDQGQGWIDSEGAFSLDGSNSDGSLQGQGPVLTPRGINATSENEPYSFHPSGAHFLFADGHVQFLAESLTLEVLAALSTRAGGETVNGSDL
jgi:prepilin-type processing-associated H-X9-DG protein/prepilin-type N-terminal cleavage/methylation domain-containing protein